MLTRCNSETDIKTRGVSIFWEEFAGLIRMLCKRCPAYSGRESLLGFLRELRVRMRSELKIENLANWLNPLISGWIAYYGHFSRSSLYPMCQQVNGTLVRWVRQKYKRFRYRKSKAMLFVQAIARKIPNLFAHWRAGMVGEFA